MRKKTLRIFKKINFGTWDFKPIIDQFKERFDKKDVLNTALIETGECNERIVFGWDKGEKPYQNFSYLVKSWEEGVLNEGTVESLQSPLRKIKEDLGKKAEEDIRMEVLGIRPYFEGITFHVGIKDQTGENRIVSTYRWYPRSDKIREGSPEKRVLKVNPGLEDS